MTISNFIGGAVMVAICCGGAGGSTPTALLTDGRTGLGNSVVPNISDFGFVSATFAGFGLPRVAADGETWVVRADAVALQSGGSAQAIDVIVKGHGLTVETLIAGGSPSPTGGPDLAISIDSGVRVNSNGDVVFRESVGDGELWRLFLYDGSSETWSVELQDGDPVPGFPGQSFQSFTDIAGLTADGRIALRTSDTIGPLPNSENDFLLIGDEVVAQTGVTVPTPQIDDPAQPLQGDFFTLGNFDVTEDAAAYAYDGNLDHVPSSRDRIFVSSGELVFQEGASIAGLDSNADSVRAAGSYLDASGTWSFIADLEDGTDVLLINGEAAALTGDPVPGFPGEFYDDASTARTFGDPVTRGPDEYAFVAETDHPDASSDSVLVHVADGAGTVLLRKGDSIDLDGDGALDDAIVLGIVGNLALLGDDLLATVNLVQSDGTPLGQALITIALPCPGDVTGDGEVDLGDLSMVLSRFGQTTSEGDTNGDGVVNLEDLSVVLSNFGNTCG
jgi:hypothetical protein